MRLLKFLGLNFFRIVSLILTPAFTASSTGGRLPGAFQISLGDRFFVGDLGLIIQELNTRGISSNQILQEFPEYQKEFDHIVELVHGKEFLNAASKLKSWSQNIYLGKSAFIHQNYAVVCAESNNLIDADTHIKIAADLARSINSYYQFERLLIDLETTRSSILNPYLK